MKWQALIMQPQMHLARHIIKFDIIINGAISDTSGTLPAIKITEPYSPSDRANPIPAPPINAGNTTGMMTFRNVVNLDAPKI